MHETRRLAGEALTALEKATAKNTFRNRGAVQAVVNRLAKLHNGRLPGGGSMLDRQCRGELRDHGPGEKTAAFADYLRDLATPTRLEPKPVKAEKVEPVKTESK